MFVFKLPLPKRCYKVIPSAKSKAYVSIHINNHEWANSSGFCTKAGVLSPKLLRQEFDKKVKEAITMGDFRGIGKLHLFCICYLIL